MSLRVGSMHRSRSRSTIRRSGRDGGSNKLTKCHPSSRNSSPTGRMGRLSRRTSKIDLYLSKSSRRNSSVSLAQDLDRAPTVIRSHEIKRWDGVQRMTVGWDALRRDPELWLHHGDCLIHLYEKGSSRRGASLRVSLADIESSDCRSVLDLYQLEMLDPDRSQMHEPDRTSRFSGYFEDNFPQYELYIPAPTHLSREEALHFHLTTRNVFAWMYNRPLVGDRLGQALIRLHDRMDQYKASTENLQDHILGFFEDQGYLDFRHCADHALAVLQYAEHHQLRELWTDAFVHCAGMNDELDASCEYENISRASQALIVRAHIEMDIRLERAGKSLEAFLEDDIPGSILTIGRQAHMHLDRFRSFLQCYYVGRYGYWPPTMNQYSCDALPKPVYQSMYFDLRNLYEYLSDKASYPDDLEGYASTTGINMQEGVSIYDQKHKLAPLPHPMALLPKIPEPQNRRRSIWSFFSYGQVKKERRLAAFAALKAATNHEDHQVMSSNIVREYLKFERDWAMYDHPSVDHVEARKARWLLIYAMLQILISVAKVPDEVKDTEGVDYPLCCQTAGTPPWSPNMVDPIPPQEPIEPPVSTKDTISLDGLKPSPLNVPTSEFIGPKSPKRFSLPPSLPLNAPKPLRSSSIEFLSRTEDSNLLTPPSYNLTRPLSVGTPTLPPLTTATPTGGQLRRPRSVSPGNSASPIRRDSLPISDPSTPSSSGLSGTGGWSANSSEDDMEHNSVTETDSNDGDDEADGSNNAHLKVRRPRSHTQIRKIPSGSSMQRCNPEVDQFLSS